MGNPPPNLLNEGDIAKNFSMYNHYFKLEPAHITLARSLLQSVLYYFFFVVSPGFAVGVPSAMKIFSKVPQNPGHLLALPD